MAIRESFRRALRLSEESDSSSQADNSNTSTSSSSKTSISSKSSGLRPTRSWTWGSNNKAKEVAAKERKSRSKPTKRIITHPSEKPLTEQNLRHQEMLSQFTWTFGASRPDQVESDDFVGISPCCTRAPSLADYDPRGDSDGFSSSQDSQLS
ncbi:hypothetical protein B0J13DRAFT_16421 [Dactylonectria estremocensis]|uniref:Uncharacterized protein n=1 Tax=Dactylonectria estremocensis TaxID=1079267 RepID=A0A9P9FJ81_9HYPO|nr:hypothetical protein B0J13DRAFT_16421 [Dactylonectria estremocensis]